MSKQEGEKEMVSVREFDMEKDLKAVEEMEKLCDVSPNSATAADEGTGIKKKKKKKGSMSLFVDQLGDPMSRVRHATDHIMLVAEYGEKKEMVGVIRACIKMVTRGRAATSIAPDPYVKVAYILGLRVFPTHRRLGIGTKLVERVESWCAARGAEYAYMATDAANSASLGLFTRRLAYTRFRSPALLAHPVHAHRLPVPSSVSFLRLPPEAAALLYGRLMPPSAAEFVPSDLPALLAHPLTLATFVAVPSSSTTFSLDDLPSSFAVASLWDSTRVLRFRVGGAPPAAKAALALLRALDARAPWIRVPSVRDVFRPFGVHIMYGLHMAGPEGARLMLALCRLAHNVAMTDEHCAAVVAEVGPRDPVRAAVPHWKKFSCEEDVWCMKRLRGGGGGSDDWMTSEPSTEVVFVDPREF